MLPFFYVFVIEVGAIFIPKLSLILSVDLDSAFDELLWISLVSIFIFKCGEVIGHIVITPYHHIAHFTNNIFNN